MQKRDKGAKRVPDWFGFFGGGVEKNETPENAMLREIKEELTYTPAGYKLFSRYEFFHSINNVFVLEVSDDFESKIKVEEGQYGKFFSADDIKNKTMISDSDKLIIKQLNDAFDSSPDPSTLIPRV